jgi:hypothetical protein
VPPIDDLKNKYFVQAADANPPSEPVPENFQDCLITPLIDLVDYNAELEAALATVGTGGSEAANAIGLRDGRYEGPNHIFSSFGVNIVESGAYTLDGPGGTKQLLQILIDKAKVGVDVRVLGWVSFSIMDSVLAQLGGAATIAAINARTMQSAKSLRAEPKLSKKVVLNVLSHTIIGNDTDAVGFTGGLDLAMDRFSGSAHAGPRRGMTSRRRCRGRRSRHSTITSRACGRRT